jgi:hypothetical protein
LCSVKLWMWSKSILSELYYWLAQAVITHQCSGISTITIRMDKDRRRPVARLDSPIDFTNACFFCARFGVECTCTITYVELLAVAC